MNIHIVAVEARPDHILTRLANVLVDYTGWSMSGKVNPKADLNYYFPYCSYSASDRAPGKTAAWFTHYDQGRTDKTTTWDTLAQSVDLRVTSARLYVGGLAKHGMTVLAPTPIDAVKFRPLPGQRMRSNYPRIGVSGFVYPGGRKGEKIVSALAASEAGKRCQWTASGQGWPIPCRLRDWATMEQFYQGLDFYFCPSTIEGIGYPVLESLACGVPVIIPRAVGVFDELPDVRGIYRYEAGNSDAAQDALETALADTQPIDREALRAAVGKFTPRAWADAHLDAFETVLRGPAAMVSPAKLPDWRGRSGVCYVAYGDPARNCAKRAIESFTKYMPGVGIALVSDRPLNCGETHFVQHTDTDLGARCVKTEIYDTTPKEWDYVLYLDADTEVVADISFLFQLLADGWEFVCCTNPAKYILGREMKRPDNSDELKATFDAIGTDEIVQLNGGVFGFRRCPETARLIRGWNTEWKRWGKRDQAALDRSLYASPVRTYVLGNEWNTITRYIPPERTAGILHYPMQARRWKGMVAGRLDSSEAWASLHPTGAVAK